MKTKTFLYLTVIVAIIFTACNPLLKSYNAQIDKFYNKPALYADVPHMVLVPAARYYLGPDDYEITLGGFYMSQYEITSSQYAYFLNSVKDTLTAFEGNSEMIAAYYDYKNPSSKIRLQKDTFIVVEGYENHPVTHVSYFGSKLYCDWLTAYQNQTILSAQKVLLKKPKYNRKDMEGNSTSFLLPKEYLEQPRFRLPAYYEWSAATMTYAQHDSLLLEPQFSGSNNANKVAWYDNNAGHTTHLVGTKAPNKHQIYDLSGNVWEWVEEGYPFERNQYIDWFQPYYDNYSDSICIRGGSYLSDGKQLEKYNFSGFSKDSSSAEIGFRVVQTYLDPNYSLEF